MARNKRLHVEMSLLKMSARPPGVPERRAATSRPCSSSLASRGRARGKKKALNQAG